MDFSSYLSPIFGSFLGLVIAYYIWRQRHKSDDAKLLAPEVSGALPIIGHLHLLSAEPTLARTLAAMADKYGPVFTIRFGHFPTLVVSNHEAVKECLTTNDRVLASRPPSNIGKYMAYDHAGFGFAPYGPFWREIRKFTTVELLSTHKLAQLMHVRVSEVNALMKNLYTYFEKPNQKISMGEKLGVFTLNIILRLIAGKRYFSDAEGVDGEEAHHLEHFYFLLFPIMGSRPVKSILFVL